LGGVLFGVPCGFALLRGPSVFRLVGPVLLFITMALTFLVGIGRLGSS
jgi:hypothetical protein